MDLQSALINLGLTSQEVDVYLSCLKLGSAKASEIAKKSKIKREASYYTLKLLQERGFISGIIKSGINYYSPVHPKRIMEIIEDDKQRKKEILTQILPELISLQGIGINPPEIEFYEGKEGYKTIASKLIEGKSYTLYCYVPESILHFLPIFDLQFRRKRKERNIKVEVISEDTTFMRELKQKDKEDYREIRFDNDLVSKLSICLYILPNAIGILKFNRNEQFGIYIKDKELSSLQEKIFQRLWKQAKK
jgi:sugar-specific transcriptional regulator TrmB